MVQTQCAAKLINLYTSEGKTIIVLDQTCFYPQGGGQPYDTGIITSTDENFVFQVQEVRCNEGIVTHIGLIEKGNYSIDMDVHCFVNENRRKLNSRLHSAGHVIDLALKELNLVWIPKKGYHFPEGSYVEYLGSIDDRNIEDLKLTLDQKCNEIISRNIDTTVVFDTHKLLNGKPLRTVFYGIHGILCGGTHVSNLKEIVSMGIRKIKKSNDTIKVSYTIKSTSFSEMINDFEDKNLQQTTY